MARRRRRSGPSPSDLAYRYGRFSRDVRAVRNGTIVRRWLRRRIGRTVQRIVNKI